jgi:ribonuclease HI
MGVKALNAYGDSQLVIKKISGEYLPRAIAKVGRLPRSCNETVHEEVREDQPEVETRILAPMH